MSRKIERAEIVINGEKKVFLKPNAIELIEIEDKCITSTGGMSNAIYNKLMLGLVDAKLKVEDLVKFKSEPIEMSSGEFVSIPEIGYDKWASALEEMDSFSRVELARHALRATGVTGDITFSGFKYGDIDSLAIGFFSLYDASELKRVVDEIATFCFS
ncbi:MAG: hypothetical protein ACRCX2_28390 [Paraclostridium sp.]